MATSPRSAPGSLSLDVRSGGRLHIHGIKEMPAGYDAEVAELFRDLRAASGLTEADLAAQLATRLEVVQALEQGAIYALPPWPETCRVVSTYGTLLNLDVRPLLRRIYAQVEAGIVELAPKPMPDVPFMAPPEDMNRDFQNREFQPPSRPSALPAAEPLPAPPRQVGVPPPRPSQAVPDWGIQPPQPRQVQAPQPRTQPQPQPPQWQPPPQEQTRQQPQWQPPPQQLPPPQQPRAAPQPQRPAVPPPPPQTQPKAAPRSAPAEAKPEQKKQRWVALLKWGLIPLLVFGVAIGLWLAKPSLLGFSGPNTAQSGAKPPNAAPPAPNADPNDPRSRKTDRLPGPS